VKLGRCDKSHRLARVGARALRYLRSGAPPLTLNCGYGHGFSVLEVIDAVTVNHLVALDRLKRARRLRALRKVAYYLLCIGNFRWPGKNGTTRPWLTFRTSPPRDSVQNEDPEESAKIHSGTNWRDQKSNCNIAHALAPLCRSSPRAKKL
jgi:hypothetical protein